MTPTIGGVSDLSTYHGWNCVMKKSIAAFAFTMIACGLPLCASAQLDEAQYQYVAEAEKSAADEE